MTEAFSFAVTGTDGEARTLRNAIPGVYEAVDGALGEILEATGPETVVMVVSDHGFGPEERGELIYEIEKDALLEAIAAGGAFDAYPTGPGSIRIRLREGVEDPGVFKGGPSASTWCEALAAKVLSLRYADSDEDVFDAQCKDGELLVILRKDRGTEMPTALVSKPGNVQAEGLLSYHSVSGSHRIDGIVALRGPGIRKGYTLPDTSVLDVAPTALHLLGLEVGAGMEGSVIVEALEPGYLEAHPIVKEADQVGAEGGKKTTSKEPPIPEEVLDRLRALGYESSAQ